MFIFFVLHPYSILAESNNEGVSNSGSATSVWKIENGQQYFYQDNVLVKGWFYINGKWYYSNEKAGSLYKGWLYYNQKWYFLNQDGTMKIGWLYDGGKWYYLSSSGAMQVGWLMDTGKWYYLSSNGAMQTGWLSNNKKWYYLEKNGVMKTSWIYLGKWYYLDSSGKWIPNTIADQFNYVSENKQLILVTTKGYNTSTAMIRTFDKIDNKWFQHLEITGYIGKEGFATVMQEGAKKSPRGKYTIGTAFGRYQNPGTKLPYRYITADDVWVDDSNSSLYNTWQETSQNNGRWQSAEKMNIAPYNYGFVINYNTAERIPWAGSAIFFHVSSSYTLGCTGTSQSNVISILKWLDPEKKPVIIQTPESELGKY